MKKNLFVLSSAYTYNPGDNGVSDLFNRSRRSTSCMSCLLWRNADVQILYRRWCSVTMLHHMQRLASSRIFTIGQEASLSIDVYLGWTPAEDGYTSAGDYLSRHQIRFQEVHRLAADKIQKAAQQQETSPPREATVLRPRCLVLIRQHLP